MIGFLFFFFGVMTTLGMCGLAAWTDFKGYRIPNLISFIIVGAFAISFLITSLTGQSDIIFMSWKSHLGSFVLVLLVTMAMFAFKIMGAGDSKLASAIALWLGWSGMMPFLFYMALAGGILGLTSVILKKYKPLKNPLPGTWLENAQTGSDKVPYGIAISFGAIVSFIFLGYFSLEKWVEIINQ